MSSKEKVTAKEFISSNALFYNALKNEDKIYLDSNIKIELIIYYLTLNKDYLNKVLGENDIIISLIETQNFILEDNSIIFNGMSLSLEYLMNLVSKIEESKHSSSEKILFVNYKSKPKISQPIKKAQVIQMSDINHRIFYNAIEKEKTFERTLSVNEENINYIKNIKRDFKDLMEDIIIKALFSNLDNYDKKYIKVLSAYLNIYPFTTYLRGKENIPYSSLNLHQNEIIIKRTTYNDSRITELERKIKLLIEQQSFLERRIEKYEADETVSNRILTTTEQQLYSVEKEKLSSFIELYNLRHTPEIYNENLIEYLARCYENGYILINRFLQNPIIKLFYLKNDYVSFYSAMRLDTLIDLFNPSYLISQLEEEPKIKVKH